MKNSINMLQQKTNNQEDSEDLKNIIDQSYNIRKKIKITAQNLLPAHLDSQDLFSLIANFVKSIPTDNLKISTLFRGQIPVIDKDIKKVIYLIVLELLQNIIKHANATNALVEIAYQDNKLLIIIQDNGIGYTPGKQHYGIGINNIKQQLALLNGTIKIDGALPKGTVIAIAIPFISN
jgi:signal transduction histidine kinase